MDDFKQDQLRDQGTHSDNNDVDSQLTGRIAHELNNRLSIIIGYSELLLLQNTGSGRTQDMLSEIRDAGKESAGLTKQLMDLSRGQTLLSQAIDVNFVNAKFETVKGD